MKKEIIKFRPVPYLDMACMEVSDDGVYVHIVEYLDLEEENRIMKEALEQIKENEMRGEVWKAIDIAIKALQQIKETDR